MTAPPTIDYLLNLAADSPSSVLTLLAAHPSLASQQDSHGYSLLHAAASYAHPALLTALVRTYHVDPDLRDEDGETALYNVEDVETAKLLLELGTDPEVRNLEGMRAVEKLAEEDEQPVVARWLREREAQAGGATAEEGKGGEDVERAPRLPNGVQVSVGTMGMDEAGEEPDPEFRRRIEELAARADFDDEAGQRELRALVEDAVAGISGEGQGASTRRRIG